MMQALLANIGIMTVNFLATFVTIITIDRS
jgi:hypothetical protein